MCQSAAQGGRRCPPANPTRRFRSQLAARLGCNTRLAQTATGLRAQRLQQLVDRDQKRLANLDEAIVLYGDCVTTHDVPIPEAVTRVLDGFRAEGMNPVLVGGAVRDSFDGHPPKDLDFEVHGANIDTVAKVASRFGRVDEVGKAFGVLKMTLASGEDLDLSVPRRDNNTGAGHRDFTVEFDQTMTVAEAALRRDYTLNAMAYDPRLGVLIDPHGGRTDLDAGVLRHVSPAFAEDPLRVLRGVQFAARFNMRFDPNTVEVCQKLRSDAAALPDERVWREWEKFAVKGEHLSTGLQALADTGWDHELPGLCAANTPRLRDDADRLHTMMGAGNVTEADRGALVAALVTRQMDSSTAKRFMSRTVEGLTTRRLATVLAQSEPLPTSVEHARSQAHGSATIRLRALFAAARGDAEGSRAALSLAERAGVADRPEPDLLGGSDVLSRTSRKPGPWTGQVLRDARAAQAEGVFRSPADAASWLDTRLALEPTGT